MRKTIERHWPGVVCWNRETRPEVLNTIALDVRPSAFKATHFPSFLQQEGSAPGTFVALSEAELLDDFLRPDHLHVFNVAVGDSGTGKSHLIRWMHNEIVQRNQQLGEPWWVVDVPRSSANLADVVRRILYGFDGHVVRRLREELDKGHDLSVTGAKTRVLDEFAFVLEQAFQEKQWDLAQLGRDAAVVLEYLPALLRVRELRTILADRRGGTVTTIAEHVLGKRETRDDLAPCDWQTEDLVFDYVQLNHVAGDARELAALLIEDHDIRKHAALLLNRAMPDALRNLIRFQQGDMQRALIEIRETLHKNQKELVLLIEDLSVTAGLDSELLEALQVRTRDAGQEICKLRSIVGVTHEDHAKMRENIRVGRVLKTVYFNVGIGSESEAGTIRGRDILDFASRYLNASRFSLEFLDEWASDSTLPPLPSACEVCTLRADCHSVFGEVNGRGLYPFSPEALARLYQASARDTSTKKTFNPRVMVGRVQRHCRFGGRRNV